MCKVLVVDDERDVVDLVSYNLRSSGYEVESAFDGCVALEKATQLLPDIIVLDLMLPELDGTAVCEILRRLPATQNIPILMLTACGTDAARKAASRAGVNAYVTKPFSPRVIVDKVRNLLGARNVLPPETNEL